MGIFGPRGTPDAIRQRLSDALVETVQDADIRAKLQSIGVEPRGMDYAAFERYFRSEVKKWTEFVQERGLTEK